MRKRLKRYEGTVSRFTATVGRKGSSEHISGHTSRTLLLHDIKCCETNLLLCDHVWLWHNDTYNDLKWGDRITFDGLVGKYSKSLTSVDYNIRYMSDIHVMHLPLTEEDYIEHRHGSIILRHRLDNKYLTRCDRRQLRDMVKHEGRLCKFTATFNGIVGYTNSEGEYVLRTHLTDIRYADSKKSLFSKLKFYDVEPFQHLDNGDRISFESYLYPRCKSNESHWRMLSSRKFGFTISVPQYVRAIEDTQTYNINEFSLAVPRSLSYH